MKKLVVIVIMFATILFLLLPSEKAIGINEDIILGQSCALSGPSGELGREFMHGANTYFNEVNAAGGVNGRKIKLITLDDYYEPHYAVINTLDLIQNKKAFAIFGEVGTPTSKAVIPIISQHKIPFLMPFTGAQILREPHNPYIVNMRSSYDHETRALIEYLVDVKKETKIAIFYQNDSYGKAGLLGVKKALKNKNISLLAEGKYRRNTLLIESALATILDKKPDAIIMIGAYKPSSVFIKEVKKRTLKNITFANISFVGSKALINALGKSTDNVIISQVVPISGSVNTTNTDSFIDLEGYLAAKLFVKALRNTPEPLTKKSFLNAFSTLSPTALGQELHLNIQNDKFIGLNKVYITRYEDGKFKQIMEHVE